jgi:predicted adenine nucleotide alpha hydrolase (AANH) superfamily ATPase
MCSENKKVLLHCCCAPCASAIIEWLLQNSYNITLYFYNPNIFPEQEYLIRKEELLRYAKQLNLPVVDDDYRHDEWLKQVVGMELEPERGMRCVACFKLRL